jgi:hypothetical protein
VRSNLWHEFHIGKQNKKVRNNKRPEIFNLLVVVGKILNVHDGGPAHCSRYARGALNNSAHSRRTGTGGPTAWPPHSSDLNPLDCYLRGYLATLVYAAPADNEQTLSDYRQLPRSLDRGDSLNETCRGVH